jgi:hypothetical protein
MPYSDFTLKKIKEQLGIKVVENQDLFASVRDNIHQRISIGNTQLL